MFRECTLPSLDQCFSCTGLACVQQYGISETRTPEVAVDFASSTAYVIWRQMTRLHNFNWYSYAGK
jgi:hypothetical protein